MAIEPSTKDDHFGKPVFTLVRFNNDEESMIFGQGKTKMGRKELKIICSGVDLSLSLSYVGDSG